MAAPTSTWLAEGLCLGRGRGPGMAGAVGASVVLLAGLARGYGGAAVRFDGIDDLVVATVRAIYPSADGHYTGFRPA